jgi:hypothetical protein
MKALRTKQEKPPKEPILHKVKVHPFARRMLRQIQSNVNI